MVQHLWPQDRLASAGGIVTPDRLRECLSSIGWSQRALAERLGLHETRTRRWASGRYPIPENVADWLERLAAVHDGADLPEGWPVEQESVR